MLASIPPLASAAALPELLVRRDGIARAGEIEHRLVLATPIDPLRQAISSLAATGR